MLCALVRHDSLTRGASVKCVCRRNTQERSNRHVGTVARGAASEGIKRVISKGRGDEDERGGLGGQTDQKQQEACCDNALAPLARSSSS